MLGLETEIYERQSVIKKVDQKNMVFEDVSQIDFFLEIYANFSAI